MTRQIGLARKLGAFDATLIVMGGIIGSGIFMNPAVVAQRAHTAPLIMGVWLFGGIVALLGGFIFAELARRRPDVGGMYGYLRDAFHPMLAFMSGWTALLVSMSGAIAATAVTFGLYTAPYFHLSPVAIGLSVIAIVSLINCLGVREGVGAQNLLTIVKVAAIGGIIVAGLLIPHAAVHAPELPAFTGPALLAGALGAALLPVFYSYDGWQTAPFMDRELKNPHITLPRGLILGVIAVVALYVFVTIAGLHTLGAAGLAASQAPATDIVRSALGPSAGLIITLCIAISTLGFLGNQALTIPRLYYAMAHDGVFFKQLAYVHPKTQAPIVAILTQAVISSVILFSGKYDQILNYVTSMDFLWMALCAVALLIFRARDGHRRFAGGTIFFTAVSAAVVINSYVSFPKDTLIGLAILLSGAPAYILWSRIVTERGSARPTTSPRSV
jgi:basic amino acid/polyamine antiporter, APA family